MAGPLWCVLANASAARLFEREHIEMFNQPLASLFPDRHASFLAVQLRETLWRSLSVDCAMTKA